MSKIENLIKNDSESDEKLKKLKKRKFSESSSESDEKLKKLKKRKYSSSESDEKLKKLKKRIKNYEDEP